MNFRKDFQDRQAGFQLAPMVDVVFLLLMFFMTSLIFAQWERKLGIEVPTAESGTQSRRTPGEIIINLDEEGNIFVNAVEMTPTRLEGILKEVAAIFKGHPVIIRADRRTDHQYVMRVLDICRRVDIWHVSFATIADEKQGP